MISVFSFNLLSALRVLPEKSILTPILQNEQSSQSEPSMKTFYKKIAKYEKDPSVRNILLFLCGDSEYSEILTNLSVLDSMGFALIFLNDQDLKPYLRELSERGKSEGLLETLIITGFSQDTPSVLSRFYENTGDIQTVGILSIYSQLYLRSEVLDMFASSYKYQLNRLELYHSRCLLEIEENRLLNKKKPKGKSIRCYYCGKSIAHGDLLGSPAIMKRGDPQSASKLMLNHCPSCDASLPKCCVCLNHIKSINPYFTLDKMKTQENVIEILSWCENCHHGGHSTHLMEWFAEMEQCPVYGCECRCNSLD